MSGTDRSAMPGDAGPPFAQRGTYAKLFREGYRFNFYQALRLLERAFPDSPPLGTTAEAREERIRISPDPSMVFPPADIRRVTWDPKKEQARIVATFLGLYGVDAPMAPVFADPITHEEADAVPLKTLLDIFNQRFYTYFYRSWAKYRPNLHVGDGQEADGERLRSVAGLGTPYLGSGPASTLRLSSFAARLAPRARNPEGLAAMVASLLKDAQADAPQVTVLEHQPRWVDMPHTTRLGQQHGHRLGASVLLGRRLYDVAGKFRLQIGPLDMKSYLRLLPEGDLAPLVQGTVHLYTADRLDYDVELQLRSSEVPRLALGDARNQLGRTACLGTPRDDLLPRIVSYDAPASATPEARASSP